MTEMLTNFPIGCQPVDGESFPLWLKCVDCGHIEHRQEQGQRHCADCIEERAALKASILDEEDDRKLTLLADAYHWLNRDEAEGNGFADAHSSMPATHGSNIGMAMA